TAVRREGRIDLLVEVVGRIALRDERADVAEGLAAARRSTGTFSCEVAIVRDRRVSVVLEVGQVGIHPVREDGDVHAGPRVAEAVRALRAAPDRTARVDAVVGVDQMQRLRLEERRGRVPTESRAADPRLRGAGGRARADRLRTRSEEYTSELQSLAY